MSSLLKFYTRSFDKSPYLTLVITNATLMSLGDISAQIITLSTSFPLEGSSSFLSSYDLARTARFGFFGGAVGPVLGAWNKLLEVKFPLKPLVGLTPSFPPEKLDLPPNIDVGKGARWERSPANQKRRMEEETKRNMGGGSKKVGDDGISYLALGKRLASDQLFMAPTGLLFLLVSMSLMEGLDDEEILDKLRNYYPGILLANWKVWPLLQLFSFRFVPLRYRVPFAAVAGIFWTTYVSLTIQAPVAISVE